MTVNGGTTRKHIYAPVLLLAEQRKCDSRQRLIESETRGEDSDVPGMAAYRFSDRSHQRVPLVAGKIYQLRATYAVNYTRREQLVLSPIVR